jgi:hypothetical protein
VAWWFGSKRGKKLWETGKVSTPWEPDRASIYEHIENHTWSGVTGLVEGGETLPDEDVIRKDKPFGWVPGALDRLATQHGLGLGGAGKEGDVFGALGDAVAAPDRSTMDRLYGLVRDDDAIGYIDALIEKIVEAGGEVDGEDLHRLGKYFATQAPDRGAVKFGLAIVGLFTADEDLELIHTLGRHEEFTLYAATALARRTQNPDLELWELAKQVGGWGRTHVVERLAGTERPEIKAWLLHEGEPNHVMNEDADEDDDDEGATTDGLLQALNNAAPEDDIVDSAGDILHRLVAYDPSGDDRDIDDFPDGLPAVRRYLDLIKQRACDFKEFLVAKEIRDFVRDETGKRTPYTETGWTSEARAELGETTSAFMAPDAWTERAMTGLDSKDRLVFLDAREVADELGIDTWPYSFRRQESGQGDEWFALMRTDDPTRIDQVVALAERDLPLDELATGPGLDLGVGDGAEHQLSLRIIVQDLYRFPGRGWSLLKVALNGPVIGGRHQVVNALDAWGRDRWPNDTEVALERALSREPHDEVRKRLTNLLANKPLDAD